MFYSDEDFEAYVAQQQAELEAHGHIVNKDHGPRKKTAAEATLGILNVVVPALILTAVGILFWTSGGETRDHFKNSWHKMISAAASMGGQDYNLDADGSPNRKGQRKSR